MTTYYATFPEGFSELTKKLLLKFDATATVLDLGSSYIHFSSNKNVIDIKEIPFFEVVFFVINFFPKDQNYSFENQIEWFKRNLNIVDTKLKDFEKGRDFTYRIVGSAPGLENKEMERKIKDLNEVMDINRINPDFDIRIIQKEFYGFIGIRITKPAEYVDPMQRGSVRKEIASYMIDLSEPDKDDVFLDPFCGGGIIPLMRFKDTRFKSIYSNDVDTNLIKEKARGIRGGNFNIIEGSIDTLEERLKEKVNKIVTDPPWGLASKVNDIEKMYVNMLKTFVKISQKDSLVILLTPHVELVKKYILQKKNYELLEEHKGKVSGRDSYILKLKVL